MPGSAGGETVVRQVPLGYHLHLHLRDHIHPHLDRNLEDQREVRSLLPDFNTLTFC